MSHQTISCSTELASWCNIPIFSKNDKFSMADFKFVESLSLNTNLNYTVGKQPNSNNNLPLIPPLSLNLNLSYKYSSWYFSIMGDMATSQEETGIFEERTNGYIAINTRVKKAMKKCTAALILIC